MSARFASPVVASAVPEGFQNAASAMSSFPLAYGPPPGLAYPPGISHDTVPPTNPSHGPSSIVESQINGSSTHGELFPLIMRGEGIPGQSMSTERRAFSVRKKYYCP